MKSLAEPPSTAVSDLERANDGFVTGKLMKKQEAAWPNPPLALNYPEETRRPGMIHLTKRLAWAADAIDWQEIGADGTKYALLEGERSKAGAAFSYAFFIPAGFWDPCHWHSADARVFVASGRLQLGYSEVMDRGKLTAYPAGSFLLVPAGARHFDGSDVDTLIFGTAIGPWETHYVDPSVRASAGTTLAPS
jgi:hypothetical protein